MAFKNWEQIIFKFESTKCEKKIMQKNIFFKNCTKKIIQIFEFAKKKTRFFRHQKFFLQSLSNFFFGIDFKKLLFCQNRHNMIKENNYNLILIISCQLKCDNYDSSAVSNSFLVLSPDFF